MIVSARLLCTCASSLCTTFLQYLPLLHVGPFQVNSDCDEFGNTALHMCVIHDQADMYDFLVDYCAASEAVRNHAGLTPLCLAAHAGKSDMLQHVYNRRRRAFYSFGKVCVVLLLLKSGCFVNPGSASVVIRCGVVRQDITSCRRARGLADGLFDCCVAVAILRACVSLPCCAACCYRSHAEACFWVRLARCQTGRKHLGSLPECHC
jgi:hypothetical protein